MSVFPPETRTRFAELYPEAICELQHRLGDHPLMSLESLAMLADGLPANSVECLQSDLPIGVDGAPPQTGRSGGETIRTIAEARSWVMLKRVEQDPAYRRLLYDLLAELRPETEAATGPMLTLQSLIFITSTRGDHAVPFRPRTQHSDAGPRNQDHHQFPRRRSALRAQRDARGLSLRRAARNWRGRTISPTMAAQCPSRPGRAVFVPVMLPHFFRNAPEVSISLFVTWRSEWSYAEADARAFNSLLRRRRRQPVAPGRWPKSNWTRANADRVLRKLRAVD